MFCLLQEEWERIYKTCSEKLFAVWITQRGFDQFEIAPLQYPELNLGLASKVEKNLAHTQNEQALENVAEISFYTGAAQYGYVKGIRFFEL